MYIVKTEAGKHFNIKLNGYTQFENVSSQLALVGDQTWKVRGVYTVNGRWLKLCQAAQQTGLPYEKQYAYQFCTLNVLVLHRWGYATL